MPPWLLGRSWLARLLYVQEAGRAESTGFVHSGRRWHRRIPSRGAVAIPRGPCPLPVRSIRHPLNSVPGSDYTDRMESLNLPLDYAAIERILPHRYPFLLVDRITEFEVDKRIVGVKNVSLNERYLAHRPGERPVLPPTILTEAVNQVGAILSQTGEPGEAHLPRGHRAGSLSPAGAPRRRPSHRGQSETAPQPHGPAARCGHGQRQSGARRPDDVRARSHELAGYT